MSEAGRKILVVDDEQVMRIELFQALIGEGYAVSVAEHGRMALDILEREPVSLLITDIKMPEMDGLELLRRVKAVGPAVPVVIMTGFATVDSAISAMKLGAFDYLLKPFPLEVLRETVARALEIGATPPGPGLAVGVAGPGRRAGGQRAVVGQDPAWLKVLERARAVASSTATVLILGESGTGKEVLARLLHAESERSNGPFVALNCAALPDGLLESELFGHERGAFTGATETKPGKFVQANGGTLFLDEIGDMDLSLQAKILRVLQERVVDPVGSRASKAVDVRILAATHRDLSGAVKAGAFREDLYWRLNVIPLGVPPLRERMEDVAILFSHFCRQYGGTEPKLEPGAMAILSNYRWPGNVRELQSLCQRLAILYPDQAIVPTMLPPEMRGVETDRQTPAEGLWGMEREAIVKALREHNGNQSAAARSLRIPRHILIYRMKKYGLS